VGGAQPGVVIRGGCGCWYGGCGHWGCEMIVGGVRRRVWGDHWG
jgi:hypothetical protein